VLAAGQQVRNPLYLVTFLEELRTFGSYELLESRMDFYLAATTVPELFVKVLTRFEDDFDEQCPGLVKSTMSLICLSRMGLNETELQRQCTSQMGRQDDVLLFSSVCN
jgi:hypothetical protein